MRPFRVDPVGPVQAYKTFAVSSPLATHTRRTTCADVECPRHANGWKTVIDPGTDLGARQLQYIRLHSGRAYVDVSAPEEAMVTLLFPPGQQCFEEHRVPLDRPANYLTRDGDWRAHLGGVRVYDRPDQWADDFATHQDAIAGTVRRG